MDHFEQAKKHLKINLAQACQELNTWQDSSLLGDGVMREVAKMLVIVPAADKMRVVESMINRMARETIVRGKR